jgi:hypothetical protein
MLGVEYRSLLPIVEQANSPSSRRYRNGNGRQQVKVETTFRACDVQALLHGQLKQARSPCAGAGVGFDFNTNLGEKRYSLTPPSARYLNPLRCMGRKKP